MNRYFSMSTNLSNNKQEPIVYHKIRHDLNQNVQYSIKNNQLNQYNPNLSNNSSPLSKYQNKKVILPF